MEYQTSLLETESKKHAEAQVLIKVVAEKREYLPDYASQGAAGADLRACIQEEIILAPSATVLVPTGLRFEIPQGYEIQIRPRSGLALKHQVTVLNTPGTIDSDYRGEVGVILINLGKEPYTIVPGSRIAQCVVNEITRAVFETHESLNLTERGHGGFGSTGSH